MSVAIASTSRFLHSAVCSCPVRRDELRKHDSLQCNRVCRGLSCECKRFAFLCCHCCTLWSGSVQRLEVVGWSALAQADLLTHRVGSVPRAFHGHSAAVCCHIAALLTLLTDCTTYVPVSSMTMRSVDFTLTPTNTPLDHLDSNQCRVRLRKSMHSPKLGISTLEGLPFKRMQAV